MAAIGKCTTVVSFVPSFSFIINHRSYRHFFLLSLFSFTIIFCFCYSPNLTTHLNHHTPFSPNRVSRLFLIVDFGFSGARLFANVSFNFSYGGLFPRRGEQD